MKYVSMFILFAAVALMPISVHAQNVSTDLALESIPTDPQPGTTVSVTAKSFGADLSQASLVWTYNGIAVARGTGKTTISVVAPAAGATGVIGVTVSGGGIDSATSGTLVLRPGSVDMLWEAADSYVHPFYKGKALLPIGGLIRVTAIPAPSAPKNLSYNWSRDNSALQSDSGFGKSSLLVRSNALSPQEKIDVSMHTGTFIGNSTIRLGPTDPVLRMYTNKEGFIEYAQGYTDTVPFKNAGAVLHAEPYYFSSPNGISTDLLIDTTIDGVHISPPQQNEFGLSRPATAGQSNLRLAITTVVYGLQHLEKTFTLLFN